ncbi:MAG: hypothetical protein V1892_03775 [bacterium]
MKKQKNFKICGYKLTSKVPEYLSFIILLVGLTVSITLANFCPTNLNAEMLSPADPLSVATPAKTENVIIAIIDGIRYKDSFGDTSHQYIPHIWNELRPQGTIYSNLWDVGITATTGGHQTTITGVTQLLKNNGKLTSDQRTKQPSIFEYYRKQKNIALNKVWAVVAKTGNLHALDYSLNPDCGYNWRATLRCTDHTPDASTYGHS